MLGSRIDGTVVVIECAFSINLTALTLEQVLNKRHKLVKDAVSNMVLEMRMQSGDESADRLEGDLNAAVFNNRVPADFNNDATFTEAMLKANTIKATILNKMFVKDYAASEMVFGPQSEFSKGLEELIGPPNSDLVKGMREEHCERTDSHEPFRWSNYGIETTSRASMVRLPSLTAGRPATDCSRAHSLTRGCSGPEKRAALAVQTQAEAAEMLCGALSKRPRRLLPPGTPSI